MGAPMRILLLGPTASGKTDLSIALARMTGAVVVGVDSRQCYRGMEIGTAAPTPEQRAEIPHRNVAELDPRTPETVADFVAREARWREEIAGEGRRVLYCGGATLHIQSLIQPLDAVPPADPRNLEHLHAEIATLGLPALFDRLRDVDPDYAARMDGLNRQRIVRALDVWMQTGHPFSSFHRQTAPTPPPDLAVFGIRQPRPRLHERIEARARRLFDDPFLEEAQRLDARLRGPSAGTPVDAAAPSLLRTLAYPEAIELSAGRITRSEAITRAATATRRYARRQATWFGRWPFIHWLEPTPDTPSEELARTLFESVAAMEKNSYF